MTVPWYIYFWSVLLPLAFGLFLAPGFSLAKPQKVQWQGWFESHAHPDCGPCEQGVCGVLGWGRPGSRIPPWERRQAGWHSHHRRIWVRGRLPQRVHGRWEGAVWSKGKKKKDPGWVDNRCPPEGLWFEIQTKLASLIAEDLSSGESGFESSRNHSTFFAQSLRRVRLFGTSWTAACHASLSFTMSQSLLKLMSTKSMMPSNHLILSSLSLPAFKLSQHLGLSQWVGSLQQVAKALELQLQC